MIKSIFRKGLCNCFAALMCCWNYPVLYLELGASLESLESAEFDTFMALSALKDPKIKELLNCIARIDVDNVQKNSQTVSAQFWKQLKENSNG